MIKYSKWQCKCGFVNESKYCLMCGTLNTDSTPINVVHDQSNIKEFHDNIKSITNKAKQELGTVTDNLKENIKNTHFDEKAEKFKIEAVKTAENVSSTIITTTKQANNKLTLVKENVNSQLNEIDVEGVKQNLNNKTQQVTEVITSVKDNVVSKINEIDVEGIKNDLGEQVQHGSQSTVSTLNKFNKKIIGIAAALLILCFGGYFAYKSHNENMYIDECIAIHNTLLVTQNHMDNISILKDGTDDDVSKLISQLEQDVDELMNKAQDLNGINEPDKYKGTNSKIIDLINTDKEQLNLVISILKEPLDIKAIDKCNILSEYDSKIKNIAKGINVEKTNFAGILKISTNADALESYVKHAIKQAEIKKKQEIQSKKNALNTNYVFACSANGYDYYIVPNSVTERVSKTSYGAHFGTEVKETKDGDVTREIVICFSHAEGKIWYETNAADIGRQKTTDQNYIANSIYTTVINKGLSKMNYGVNTLNEDCNRVKQQLDAIHAKIKQKI